MVYLLVFAIFFAGCAGRSANPIQTHMQGDNERSCEGLMMEMDQIDADMRSILPKTNKGAGNVLLGAAGFFFIVPWFFMDFKEAEKIEYDAMRNRYNHLLVIATEKKCDLKGAQRIPSIEEIERMSKEEREAFREELERNAKEQAERAQEADKVVN